MIDRESFDEWLAHPITEHVLKRVGEMAEKNKQQWISDSWDNGNSDPRLLIDLKARAEAAKDLSELRYEDIDDEESKRDQADRVQGTGSADQG